MTKKRTTKKPATSGKRKSIKGFLTDKRVRIGLGVFLIVFSFILLLAFISFLFTWKFDHSIEWSHLFNNDSPKAENWAAKIGAVLANQCINKWFGLGAFSFPFITALFGFRVLKINLIPFGRSIRHSLLATIWLSIFLGFIFADNGYLGSGPGGMNGVLLADWLNNLIGKIGTFFILLITLFIFLMFTFDGFIPLLKNIPEKLRDLKINDSEPLKKSKKPNTKSEPETKEKIIPDTPLTIEITDNEVLTDGNKPENINDDIDLSEDFDIPEFTPKKPVADPELTIEDKKTGPEDEDKPDEDPLDRLGQYDPTLDLSDYQFPDISLLTEHKSGNTEVSKEELITNKNKIVETLGNYKIKIEKIKATIGPTITLYEIVPAAGVRVSKIKNLEDDIALSLSALGIRIIAPIPGKGTIGIEVPNRNPETVSMRNILSSNKFQDSKYELPIAIGKTISNETYVFDLAKAPHLLVAGATGQGKSVGLNVILTSLLYKKHPSQLKFVLIDPKKVELTLYSRIEKHYLAKLPDVEEAIITNTQEIVNTVHSLTVEMDQRYDLLKKAKVRNIIEYNAKFLDRKLNPENGHRFFPYIVLVVDEFADLIMSAGKEIESPIARIAQLARAVGIHLIIATQRPSINIITGLIKANFPARIAFRVTAMVDSRTILDSPGANQLIGRGDMLISIGGNMERLQCAFVDTPELERLTDFIGEQRGYPSAFILPEYSMEEGGELLNIDLAKRDEMFDDAARLVVIHQQGSTSLIQRKFSIGYNRAGRIIDQLEAAGIVGPNEGSKARQVYYTDEYSLEQYLNTL